MDRAQMEQGEELLITQLREASDASSHRTMLMTLRV